MLFRLLRRKVVKDVARLAVRLVAAPPQGSLALPPLLAVAVQQSHFLATKNS